MADLTVALQKGIMHDIIEGPASKPVREILKQDFDTVDETDFQEGSFRSRFRFKSFSPIVFRYFRDVSGLQPNDYLKSLCSNRLQEVTNPGKSGSQFYFSTDGKFLIKTVEEEERKFLMEILPTYYTIHPETLLPKFFGLYRIERNFKNISCVVMNNIILSSIKPQEKYDLKGSTFNRKASKTEGNKSLPTYKDLDFLDRHPNGFILDEHIYNDLVRTLEQDCEFLESNNIVDYSLLLAVFNLDVAAREEAERRSGDATPPSTSAGSQNDLFNVQGGIKAKNEKGEQLILFMGIIDILINYGPAKKAEYRLNAIAGNGDTASVIPPDQYSLRFQNFMTTNVFRKKLSRRKRLQVRTAACACCSSINSILYFFLIHDRDTCIRITSCERRNNYIHILMTQLKFYRWFAASLMKRNNRGPVIIRWTAPVIDSRFSELD